MPPSCAERNAITVEHIGALIRKATRKRIEGNLAAMRLVFERTTGRPIDEKAASVVDFGGRRTRG